VRDVLLVVQYGRAFTHTEPTQDVQVAIVLVLLQEVNNRVDVVVGDVVYNLAAIVDHLHQHVTCAASDLTLEYGMSCHKVVTSQ